MRQIQNQACPEWAPERITGLNALPRVRLNFLPTPLAEMKRLSERLGGPRIFIKRDDLTGPALGGNKTRKLEFLLGEALHQGSDTVVTGGALQSNHCRQTAAAAAAAGLECHLALGGEAPDHPTGNLLLDDLLGARVHWCGRYNQGELIPDIDAGLRASGRRPYLIPYGGSNGVGALGFVAAMTEVREQLERLNLKIDCLVTPSSSGGTQAGMAVGADLNGLETKVLGVAIDRGEPGWPPYETEMAVIANQAAARLGLERKYTADHFRVRYDYLGGGYGVVGPLEKEAIRLAASCEGVLLDPVYSGRAMGALIDLIRRREFSRADTVLFWHTGGLPALFQYSRELA